MEILYSIYVFSGLIKSFIIFFNINFYLDFTLISALFVIFGVLFRNRLNFFLKRTHVLSFFLLLLFFLWIGISLIYSQSDNFKYEKIFLFGTNILAFLIPAVSKNFEVKKFIKASMVIVLFFAVLYLIIYFLNLSAGVSIVNDRLNLKNLYLRLGHDLGLFWIILFSYNGALYNKIDFLLKWIFFVLLIFIGARGPIIFSVFIFLLHFLTRKKNKIKIKQKIVYFIFLTILFSIGFVFLRDFFLIFIERTLFRLELLVVQFDNLVNGNYDSAGLRVQQIIAAFKFIFLNFKNFIIGSGFGAFAKEIYGSDFKSYPHNVFLEIWFELGLVGLLIWIFFLFSILRKIYFKSLISFFCILYFILNIMKSSSIIDIRTFFAFLSLYFFNSKDNLAQNLKRDESNI